MGSWASPIKVPALFSRGLGTCTTCMLLYSLAGYAPLGATLLPMCCSLQLPRDEPQDPRRLQPPSFPPLPHIALSLTACLPGVCFLENLH